MRIIMRIRAGILALSTLLLFSCDNTQKENTHPEQIKAVQTVYYGGDIVTMDGDNVWPFKPSPVIDPVLLLPRL